MSEGTGRCWPFVVALSLLAALAYANHFDNSFHFDDFHTITENAAIRDLRNLPRLLADQAVFSTLPTHQVYRPLVTASLAIDYWLGGGLEPWAFHATTFAWFLAQVALMYGLYRVWFAADRWAAAFAAAVYAVHPVSAETVNYIIQRAEIYSTAGVVAALLVYARFQRRRAYGFYLAPFVLACLAKPPALVFPALLLLYARLYETDRWAEALRAALPSLATAGAVAALLAAKTGPGFDAGGGSAGLYWLTQAWVTLRYVSLFFWPAGLSADSDMRLLAGWGPEAALGCLFLLALLATTIWAARRESTRPAAMGLGWFLIALAPTALHPLAEVANDHRMYFPFAGLAAAAVWAARLAAVRTGRIRVAAAAGCLLLAGATWATHERNEVWRSEESLWLDVTRKSPRNGRGWMNYGLTQMSQGEYERALECFERAQRLSPAYSILEVNLGIAKAALGQSREAEEHFRRALLLSPDQAASNFYYGRWLSEQGRYVEAVERFEAALAIQPADLSARRSLMQAHFTQQNWSVLRRLADETLRIDASDSVARGYRARLDSLEFEIETARRAAARDPSPEAYLDLSLLSYRAGRFEDCIEAARQALELRPGYAAAYINVASGYNAMERWDEGIAAARKALELDPSNELARNNLSWAVAQKRRP